MAKCLKRRILSEETLMKWNEVVRGTMRQLDCSVVFTFGQHLKATKILKALHDRGTLSDPRDSLCLRPSSRSK
jgi:hypothetical protein